MKKDKLESNVREDDILWAEATAGVRPIEKAPPRPKKRAPTGASRTDPQADDDFEVLRTFQDLVDGEFVDGRAPDCSKLDLLRLRNAEFPLQANLDLHGMNREEAHAALFAFFDESVSRGHRCVLVVTGRGLRSPDQKPVLKELLARWLAVGRLSAYVLAFTAAKAQDGGEGALYVLLRRNPKAI